MRIPYLFILAQIAKHSILQVIVFLLTRLKVAYQLITLVREKCDGR